MIKVEKITIQEFRGIRALSLDFNSKSYAIAGPNGTGKSGVVDAIEFALTGNISRLSGQGRGDLSVLKHGPHVDSSRAPEKAFVTLEISIPSLQKRVSITRNVKNSRVLAMTPEDPKVREIFEAFAKHPEFVLSRREIIKYVLAEPGARAMEVQSLLQLDELEDARKMFLRISNACDKELKPLEQQESLTRASFMRVMGIDDITQSKILAAVNEKRKILGLPDLPRLLGRTSLKDGLESLPPATASRIPKIQARIDIATTVTAIRGLSDITIQKELEIAVAAIEKLKTDEADLKALEKESLLNTALKVFDEHICPVCETEWKPEHFRKVVGEQLQRLDVVSKARIATERLFTPILKKIEDVRVNIKSIISYGPLFVPAYVTTDLEDYNKRLGDKLKTIRNFLPLSDTLEALNVDSADPQKANTALEEMGRLVEAIPDPTDRDAARDYLTSVDERWGTYRVFVANLNTAKKKADIAKQTYDIFTRSTDDALEDIYQQVEGEFKSFYRAINDDESDFEAKLTPSIGKLSFGVDFYGRGSFPPGAYHSEGHQDAMGLCLYLALMKHILGDGFSLAVLDDVLMSVDSGHRREVCRLLKTEFPNTQFILTTHDPVWLRHMKTAGLIDAKAGVEFQSWDVDKGPTQWKDIDVWNEIDDYINKNDIRAGASLLRHYMEYLSAEYCSELRGKVEYRGDNRYDLGSLLPGAASAMRDLLKKAKTAATSWQDAALVQRVTERETAFQIAAQAVLDDKWQYVNPAIHFNELETLSKADFKPVVDAFKTLTDQFACEKCGGILYISGVGYSKDALRCPCPELSFTLLKKE